jgi:hypothetical protein
MVDVALAAAAAAVGGPTAALAAASAGLAGAGAAGAPSEVSAPVPTKRERVPSALERFQQDQDMFHTARNAPEDTDVSGSLCGFTMHSGHLLSCWPELLLVFAH